MILINSGKCQAYHSFNLMQNRLMSLSSDSINAMIWMTALSFLLGSYVILLRENEWPRPSCACSTSSSLKSDRNSAKCRRTPLINSRMFSSDDTLISNCLLIRRDKFISWTPKIILFLLLGNFDSKKSTIVGLSSESLRINISFRASSVLLNFWNDYNSTYSLNVDYFNNDCSTSFVDCPIISCCMTLKIE